MGWFSKKIVGRLVRNSSYSGFKEASKSDKCPPAGSEIPFAKLMNPGFADDYVGCDVVTTAQFVASGAGNYMLQISLEDKTVFRCLPPGATGEKNPLSGEIDANFVVVPKASSNLVFELKPGDLVKLRGGNHVSSAIIGGSYKQVVFVSTSMERKIVEEKLRERQVTIAPRATKPDLIEIEEVGVQNMAKSPLEILRGYSVLSNNDIKFGIRLINNTGFVIIDAVVILDYSKNLFSTKDSELQHLGNIMLGNARTATYILKPLGCIHNEQINALITYKDHTGKKQTLHMRPKEVHCVCPFLKEKPLSEGEYSRLAANSEFVQEGISFKGITVDDLAKFMGETCRHMLYKVKEYDLEGKKVIYLSGESLGEKAYYLLTAVIQDYKGLTQVVLRAHSDKKYGLNGFMNEMVDSIRHLVGSVQNAKEIGIIENTQVINIIDSVVQRTSFNMDEGGKAQVNIRESMMQRSTIGASARKCPNCGREVEANEKFCLECGAKL